MDSELGGGRVRRRRARDCGFLPERISLKCEILSVKGRINDGAPSWRSSGRPDHRHDPRLSPPVS